MKATKIRYLDQYLKDTEIQKVTERYSGNPESIPDKSNPVLFMDIYSPIGDTEKDRPVIFWCHGSGGTKDDVGGEYSKRGYVVCAIDYRITPGNFTNLEQLFAATDLAAAMRYVYANAARLGINTGKMIPHGVSSGAVTVIHENIFQANHDNPYFLTEGVNRSNHGFPFIPLACVSISGAANSKFQDLIQSGVKQQIMETGDKDRTILTSEQIKTFNLLHAEQPLCTQAIYNAGHSIPHILCYADIIPKLYALVK